MEFSIDIHTTIDGEITIEDFSKEYGQYLPENIEVTTSYDLYKYSESTTINSVLKVSLNEMTLLDVLVNDHDEDLDSCTFNVVDDGYYIIEHIILPTTDWYKNASEEYKKYYKTIYISDNQKVYKEVDGKLEECTIKEILERNIEGTTIKKCKVDVFYTGNLLQCYINRCKEIFNSLLNQCLPNNYNENIYARDFIWMTLNIIDYLVGFKQFMEAERIISVFRTCGGFCTLLAPGQNKHLSCGCS